MSSSACLLLVRVEHLVNRQVEEPRDSECHITGYAQHTLSLASFAGQAVTLRFTGTEDSVDQTSFVIDDTAINVS
ncbi:MAG TPA: hypothetical protein VGI64_07060 [Streptosporangiaceae bacterium]|jgi:hypothetical protein